MSVFKSMRFVCLRLCLCRGVFVFVFVLVNCSSNNVSCEFGKFRVDSRLRKLLSAPVARFE